MDDNAHFAMTGTIFVCLKYGKNLDLRVQGRGLEEHTFKADICVPSLKRESSHSVNN